MQLVILAGVAAAVPLAAYLAVRLRARSSRMVLERLQSIQQARYAGRAGAAVPPAPEPERELLPTLSKVLAATAYTQRLMDDLSRAGWKLKPSEFVGIALGSMGAGMILLTILTQNAGLALVGAAVGLFTPRMIMKAAIDKRKHALESQIADMLMLITSALNSGYSFMRALQVVVREMPPPISEVCKKVVDENRLGVPLEDALTRMADRVGSYDLGLVATAVIIQNQVGGSLAEVLASIGETVRERFQIQAEVSALTAEGRMSGVILMLLAPGIALALAIINPGYVSALVSDPLGIKMIVGAVVFQILAYAILKRMMKIDV